ncbi:Chaperone protein HtpG [Saezia sanguinis]|uniref:Chaperone protein HtpG n=1 Tax=Saezia sanguinis TaxID=1965230 RepID=A0A433SDX8_9BURK|nr:molecular chaperone HtpG [Saezia sanguinis]RUS66969.1 Chaperone protein HtpG [Saezia sanguinis]
MSKQTQSFQAEVKQLLHLVTHSLYSNKEIFLRELVSNASDACDKLRFEAIDKPALYEDEPDLQIRLSIDKEARTLTITDNGIGMSFEEAASNLGTIAKSGTREFISQLEGDQKKDANLIGQFGVGFYSGFIVADRITVESRRAGLNAEDGVRWQSEGAGEFEIENIAREQRGTSVTLHLREGEDEWLESWKVRQIISRYSDHISLPILMRQQEWDKDKGEYIEQDAWEPVNQANALWTRSKNEISDEQYIEFYKQISWDSEAPLAWTHNRVEGKTEYTQLLYIPSHAPMDMWNRDSKAGVKLYVKRIFIMDDAQQLLPNYLRFVKGVIDSADLPLNVSRELLQDSRDVRMIRDGSTKRVLSLLEDMADSEDTAKQEKYQTFWREFGPVLKEGVGEDNNNRERIAKLLRFASTQSDAQTVSLADYVARMQDGQKAIYYVTADTLATAKNSPQLEIFNAKDIEVLLLTDRVDEWMLSFLQEFDGKPLQSVAKGTADLGDLQNEEEKKQAQDAGNDLQPVLEKIKNVLQERVSEVRATTRLVSSPACVVVSEGALSSHLTRLLQQAGQEVPQTQPILEINPQHALIKKLAAFKEENADQFSDLANVIFDQAVLAEGGALENPAAYVQRVNRLLM